MDSIYLPVGDGVTGTQQLDFLQAQYALTNDPQTKTTIDNAIKGLVAGDLPTAESNLQSKIMSLFNSSALPDTSQTASEQITSKASSAVSGQLDKIGDWFKKHGSDLFALVIGVIFLIAGIYVYKSN